MTDPAPIEVVAWVCVRDNAVLSARTRGQSVFYVPGGKKEPGESDIAALVREISEELGVDLDPTSIEKVVDIEAPAHGVNSGRIVAMSCYSADPHGSSASPLASAEIAEIAWLGLADRDRCAPADQILMNFLRDRGELT
ncbi:MAG: mismatch repair protein MutT [Pseudonocardiales bacterium]|nr:mismatch repair protein MutT [Pseudonocardiales bacterium]